jgi:hypothetical protein
VVFSVGAAPRLYKENLPQLGFEMSRVLELAVSAENGGSAMQLRVQLWSVKQRATEADESPLLRFVTRKRLVKMLQWNRHCGELLPNKD